MSADGTTVLPTRTAVYDRLVAAFAADSTVSVEYGDPNAYTERQVVAVMGIGPAGQQEEDKTLGAQRREERYLLEVAIQVHDPDAVRGKSVDDRAMALFDTARTAIHAAPINLGVPGVIFCAVTGLNTEGAVPARQTGWLINLQVLVGITARLNRSTS